MLCSKAQFDSCRDTKLPTDPVYATQDQQDAYLECVWDCFESNTLEWDVEGGDGDNAWSQKVQFQDDPCTYVTMEPTTKVGKDGNQWRFTPIPDSLQVSNGGEGKCTWDSVKAFSNPKAMEKFIASFGNEDVCDWGLDSHAPSEWHVFDKVKIPLDMEEGEYLLSWRWEAYTADQMWTNCADVIIGPPEEEASSPNLEDECSDYSMPTKSPVKSTPPPQSSPVTSPPAPTPVAGPPTEPTPGCPSGYSGLRPFDDCTKYHHCQNGEVVGNVLSCPGGTLFDVNYQYCNWANLVTCESPPPPPEKGCYSNNFKHCNHPDFQTENASCHTIWLPEGSRDDDACVALWESCAGIDQECCGPAICYQGSDASFAQCVVPS